MEVNKKRLSDIFGVSVRTIQNWQDQGMPVARGGGKGNEVLYDSAAANYNVTSPVFGVIAYIINDARSGEFDSCPVI